MLFREEPAAFHGVGGGGPTSCTRQTIRFGSWIASGLVLRALWFPVAKMYTTSLAAVKDRYSNEHAVRAGR